MQLLSYNWEDNYSIQITRINTPSSIFKMEKIKFGKYDEQNSINAIFMFTLAWIYICGLYVVNRTYVGFLN